MTLRDLAIMRRYTANEPSRKLIARLAAGYFAAKCGSRKRRRKTSKNFKLTD